MKILSERQAQVMQILWDAGSNLTAKQILEKREDLCANTVHAVLRQLLKNKFIEVSDIVYSGTVLTRSYVPIISRNEYVNYVCDQLKNLDHKNIVALPFISDICDMNILNNLEQMIMQRKEELKKEI